MDLKVNLLALFYKTFSFIIFDLTHGERTDHFLDRILNLFNFVQSFLVCKILHLTLIGHRPGSILINEFFMAE
jgi:hypothetical protein